ncbi:uncharacterized protein LOC133797856 [Humulus lupulus]|uniref:uncharacterized protein LOC133797856 n=1 Tax=Humulus lupulus TaxID=3486 RepID=UPI002B4054F8|nr:uncharacterized protein LOC133797856 [Humulus lupulus]
MDRGRGRGCGRGRGGRNPQTNLSPSAASAGGGHTPLPYRNTGPRGSSSGSKDKLVYVAKNQARPSSFEPKTGTSEQVKSLIHPDMPPQENSPPLFSPPSCSALSHKGTQIAQSTTNVTDDSVKSNELNISCQDLDISPPSINGDKVRPSPSKGPKLLASDRKPVNSSGSKVKLVYVSKNQARPSSFEPKTGTLEKVESLIHPDMPPQKNSPPLFSPPSCSALSHKGTQIAHSTTNVTDDSVKSNDLNISCQDLDISPHSINGDKVCPSPSKGPKPLSSDRKPVNSEPSSVSGAFDICPPKATPLNLQPSLFARNRERRDEKKRSLESEGEVLRSGMVLLKNYISLDEQVKIVKQCHRLGLGPGGFYQPGYRDGAKLHLNMMCLGKNWDPESSQYGDTRPTDGAKPPLIPKEFYQLVEKAIKDSQAHVCKEEKAANTEDFLPGMKPDICLVNFYSTNGRLGLHQDRDESSQSIKKGLPVVSFSIGDSAEFLYSDERDVDGAKKVTLKSGDVLVFGGKSRQVFHGVASIAKDTAPKTLLKETNLRQGRLNLTFRQY